MPLVTLAVYVKLTEDSRDLLFLRPTSTDNVIESAGTPSASDTLLSRAALNDSLVASSRLMPSNT